MLGCESDFEVVGEATDGEEAIVLSRSLRPDVLILDLMMPRKSGVEVVQTLQGECPETRILILTAFADGDMAKRALSAGAAKVLSKDTSRETLVDAIRLNFCPPPPARNEQTRECASSRISQRHVEILTLVAKGLNNGEIASVLGIGRDCVKAHLKTAFIRLDAASRSEAVAIAIQRGLVRI